MIIIYNKYASICSSQDDACKPKRVLCLNKYKSCPDIGNAGYNNLAPTPPLSVLKILIIQ